jgi:hypothetical protein
MIEVTPTKAMFSTSDASHKSRDADRQSSALPLHLRSDYTNDQFINDVPQKQPCKRQADFQADLGSGSWLIFAH